MLYPKSDPVQLATPGLDVTQHGLALRIEAMPWLRVVTHVATHTTSWVLKGPKSPIYVRLEGTKVSRQIGSLPFLSSKGNNLQAMNFGRFSVVSP